MLAVGHQIERQKIEADLEGNSLKVSNSIERVLTSPSGMAGVQSCAAVELICIVTYLSMIHQKTLLVLLDSFQEESREVT